MSMVTVAGNDAERLTFDTLSGPLTAVRDGDYISLDLPLNDPQPLQVLYGRRLKFGMKFAGDGN